MTGIFGHGRLRLYLLKLLDEEPRHGYDVIKQLEDRFMGVYAPSAGTIYPRLARLEEEDLVRHEVVEGRKVYHLTDAGRDELAERQQELAELEQDIEKSVRDLAREVRQDVRSSVRNLREELKTAARESRTAERHRPDSGQPGQFGLADIPGWAEAREQTQEALRQATQAVRDSGLGWLGGDHDEYVRAKDVLKVTEQLRAEVRTTVKRHGDDATLRQLYATVDVALSAVRQLTG